MEHGEMREAHGETLSDQTIAELKQATMSNDFDNAYRLVREIGRQINVFCGDDSETQISVDELTQTATVYILSGTGGGSHGGRLIFNVKERNLSIAAEHPAPRSEDSFAAKLEKFFDQKAAITRQGDFIKFRISL